MKTKTRALQGKNKKRQSASDSSTGLTTLYNNYRHTEAEELITSRIPEIRSYAIEQAIEMAEVGRPTMTDESLIFYTEGITSRCQLLLEEVNHAIDVESAKAEGVSVKEAYQKEEEDVTKEIVQEEHELRKTNKILAGLNGDHERTMKNWRYAAIALAGFSLGETMLNASIFTMLTDGVVWKAIIAAISLTILLFALPHVIEKILRRIPNVMGKIAVAGVFTTGVIYLLYGLADLRTSFMNATGNTIGDYISSHSFVLFNSAYFIVGLLLVLMYLPAEGVPEEYKTHKGMSLKKKEQEGLLKKKRERLKQIPIERDQKLGKLYAVIQMSASLGKIIESHHQSIIEEYIKKNLTERVPDPHGKMPPVFLQERPRLIQPVIA